MVENADGLDMICNRKIHYKWKIFLYQRPLNPHVYSTLLSSLSIPMSLEKSLGSYNLCLKSISTLYSWVAYKHLLFSQSISLSLLFSPKRAILK